MENSQVDAILVQRLAGMLDDKGSFVVHYMGYKKILEIQEGIESPVDAALAMCKHAGLHGVRLIGGMVGPYAVAFVPVDSCITIET